jgi:hypothetical protein
MQNSIADTGLQSPGNQRPLLGVLITVLVVNDEFGEILQRKRTDKKIKLMLVHFVCRNLCAKPTT